MTAPRFAAAATKPSEAVVTPEKIGEAARIDFWRKMLLPLLAFLLIDNHIGAVALTFIIACVFYLIVLCYACFKVPNWFRASVQTGYGFGVQVIGVVFLLLWRIDSKLRNEKLSSNDFESQFGVWQEVIICFALTYVVLTYCLSTSRQRECPIPWVFFYLMVFTTFSLYFANKAELVKIENLVVYVKTASLVALLCCMPHLYPGVDSRRSTTVVKTFFLGFLPITLVGIWLLMAYNKASNASIIAKVDGYKYAFGGVCFVLHFIEGWFWAIDEEHEKESDFDYIV